MKYIVKIMSIVDLRLVLVVLVSFWYTPGKSENPYLIEANARMNLQGISLKSIKSFGQVIARRVVRLLVAGNQGRDIRERKGCSC